MRTQVDILKEYKIPVRGKLGQHLLIDPNVQKNIVDLLHTEAGERVLEIGPGLGALTGELLSRGVSVLAVEKDPRFVKILEQIFREAVNSGMLELVCRDVLEVDLEKLLKEKKNKGIRKVISNLPYYITGPVLFHLFPLAGILKEGVLMMQLEVARRLFSEPGSKDYGRLSLSARLHADAYHAFDVSPQCFTPQPEVRSTVVRLEFHTRLKDMKVDEKRLLELIRVAFSQRRKKVLPVLSRHETFRKSRKEWEVLFEKCLIPLQARAEELRVKDFIALAQELQNAGSSRKGKV